jgi:hypothetical protein
MIFLIDERMASIDGSLRSLAIFRPPCVSLSDSLAIGEAALFLPFALVCQLSGWP